MKKFSKVLTLGIILVFILTMFTPYSAKADGLTPALKTDALGNYIVTSVKDLNALRSDIDKGIDYSGKDIELTQDIDINNDLNSFTTRNTFNGTFNGNFHVISGYNDKKSGLFSLINKDAIVKNVKMDTNVTIEDKNSIIKSCDNGNLTYGLIANENGGEVTCCFTTGTITNNISTLIGGVVGVSELQSTNAGGKIANCYSNIVFNNQSTGTPNYGGICWRGGDVLEHCYFYGKFTGNKLGKSCTQPIVYAIGKENATTCPYDKDVLGFYIVGSSKGIKHTTAEMKNKDIYTALGFDFDKTWKIDSSNDGYPYLNPENIQKTVAKVTVDVQITAADKTYDTNATVEENLKTTVKDIKVVPEDSKYADLISKYNVSATYDGTATFSAPTIGEVSITIDSSKLKINYDSNEDYQFVLGKVLTSNAKLLDNGAAVPTEDKQKEQVEDVKKAEDILYSKLGVGQGAVPEFTWNGDKTSINGKDGTTEGSVELNDYVWEVFSSARSGYSGVRAGFYDGWFKSVQDGLKKMKEAGVTPRDVKMTEWDKLVLAITAIGYDPRDIEAYDLIDIISNEDYLSTSNQTFSSQYALLGLNSYNYAIPSNGNRIDKEALIHGWAKSALGNKGADGSEVLPNAVPDMWLMTFQPIAAYYDSKGSDSKYSDVNQAMEHVFNQFSNAQTYKGSFYGGFADSYNNSWTNAQVYMTLGMAKSNIFDSKYIKNGNSILDGALEFYNIKDGTTTFDKSSYEPTQMCRGLDSLVRAYEERNSIFDCTDVKNSTVPVNNAIAQLPDADKLTLADKDKVDAAEKLYDALSDAQKSSMRQETVDKLTAAEKNVSPSQTVNVMGVTLDKTSASVTEGDTLQLTAAVAPDNATNKKVDWSSSDKTVASVDENGKVTAVKEGTATITAVSEDNKDAKAQCTVTVTENNTPKPIQITNLTKDRSFKLGDDAKVSVKAENNSDKDKDASLLVALYDEGGKFINYVCGKQTIKNGDSSILTGIMKLPEEGIYKLKAFVWDSLENMNPISDIIDISVQSNK
ncbi:Ig-like domain-containing protein [Clostridium ljungdahlii]|uniref:Kappa-carrageenase n=1 Tax=Clostridium ljungdahlii TaxID=1538 RepID=A0A168MDT5_9CLOT|nr:Ig-like domain-containing protein [Clostridium ljungdahlii]OAA84561.1 Kappa-carrageenase precursor [Clostridium ljungdahlii]